MSFGKGRRGLRTTAGPVLVAGFLVSVAGCGTSTADAQDTETSTEAHMASLSSAEKHLTVYKTATCGCCGMWVEHMREAGFTLDVHDVGNAELGIIKRDAGVPLREQSCHTAFTDDYAFEGHIPADVVARFLEEAPEQRGLAVGGMPIGSPGMEMGDRKDPYDVVAFDRAGNVAIYESR